MLRNRRPGNRSTHRRKARRVLRDMLANWEKFANEQRTWTPSCAWRFFTTSSKPSIPFRMATAEPGGSSTFWPRSRRLLDLPDPLSEPLHPQQPERLLSPSGPRDDRSRVGTVGALHARRLLRTQRCGRREDTSDQVPDERNGAPTFAHCPAHTAASVVELIFTQPYVRIGNLVDRIVGREAAAKYLKELAAAWHSGGGESRARQDLPTPQISRRALQ